MAQSAHLSGFHLWILLIAGAIASAVVPLICTIGVWAYAKDNASKFGLDLQHFPGGRHSLESVAPRFAAISVSIAIAYAWYLAQPSYFSGPTFFIHVVQLVGAQALIFTLQQWVYRRLIRKVAIFYEVSIAPVVGVTYNRDGQPELLLSDGATLPMNLVAMPSWSTDNARSKSIALSFLVGPERASVYVTKDGECFLGSQD